MKVYIHSHVQQVYQLHEDIIGRRDDFKTVSELLTAFSENLFEKFKDGHSATTIEISNYHPKFLGHSTEDLMQIPFSMDEAKTTICNEYGFKSWDDITDSRILNKPFEKAVDHLLDGDLEALMTQLNDHPDLLRTKSSFGHQATLLHYAGSNGVELWRQKVPLNLPEIVDQLIKSGASKNATANFYGGQYDTLALAATSAHPKGAGILAELEKALS